jgi:hypothetical protein
MSATAYGLSRHWRHLASSYRGQALTMLAGRHVPTSLEEFERAIEQVDAAYYQASSQYSAGTSLIPKQGLAPTIGCSHGIRQKPHGGACFPCLSGSLRRRSSRRRFGRGGAVGAVLRFTLASDRMRYGNQRRSSCVAS